MDGSRVSRFDRPSPRRSNKSVDITSLLGDSSSFSLPNAIDIASVKMRTTESMNEDETRPYTPLGSPLRSRADSVGVRLPLAALTGHLKEQDPLFQCILSFVTKPLDSLFGMTITEAFSAMQIMINEYVDDPIKNKRLLKYAPNVRKIFLKLDLMSALKEFDEKSALTARVFVPPTFREVRQIFSLAMIHSFSLKGKLVTFDADDTIYEDGGDVHKDSPMKEIIIKLLKNGLCVALCTAAGYLDSKRYEGRLKGLLDGFAEEDLDDEKLSHFMVMGGECNYLLRVNKRIEKNLEGVEERKINLEYVDENLWKDGRGVRWNKEDIKNLLDRAEVALRETSDALRLNVDILRKERSVGMINKSKKKFVYEVLEETALSVQYSLSGYDIPHCAFNGGSDVWVDVGNKALGIRALQHWFKIEGSECLHVGDRFTQTGNDAKAREVSNTLWVTNPDETVECMNILLNDLEKNEEKI